MDCNCKDCPYRKATASLFDVHIWKEDCDRYGTEFCKTDTAERRMIMDKCGQACQYNTLDGCKVEEYTGVCPLTNTAPQITEHKMTNAARIRSMSDEELAIRILKNIPMHAWPDSVREIYFSCDKPSKENPKKAWLEWLQQPAEGE